MRRVLFIRHGATAGNLERRYVGRTDEPLCPEGEKALMPRSGSMPVPDALFVSPMLRARRTAEILFPGVRQTVCGDLRETDFGMFEGRTASELASCPEYSAWVDGNCEGPIPGGEDVSGFKARCREAFLASIDTVPEGGFAVFVAHGGVIMAILEALAVPKKAFYEYHIGNGQSVQCIEQSRVLTVISDLKQ